MNGTLDVCREMLLDPDTVTGLGDAGAHVNLISDCSASTFHLTHWARDRTAGEKLPVELLVHKLTGANAGLYGFDDRGTVGRGQARRPQRDRLRATCGSSRLSCATTCPTGVEPDPAAGRGLPGHPGRR